MFIHVHRCQAPVVEEERFAQTRRSSLFRKPLAFLCLVPYRRVQNQPQRPIL